MEREIKFRDKRLDKDNGYGDLRQETTEDYKQRYKRICDSEKFKETHKSLGENIKIE